jgi:hypothetical protein
MVKERKREIRRERMRLYEGEKEGNSGKKGERLREKSLRKREKKS